MTTNQTIQAEKVRQLSEFIAEALWAVPIYAGLAADYIALGDVRGLHRSLNQLAACLHRALTTYKEIHALLASNDGGAA